MSRGDLLVELAQLGEATKEEAEQLEADPRLERRLQELDDADRWFRVVFDTAEQLAAIQTKLLIVEAQQAALRRAERIRQSILLGLVIGTSTGLLIWSPEWLVGVPPAPMEVQIVEPAIPAIALHRTHEDAKREALQSGAVAREGDVIQLSYRRGSARYGVIVSLDGNGTVSLHHPASIADRTALRRSGFVALPHGYQLDDGPRYERFFFVTSDAPIDVRAVLKAAETLPEDVATTAPLALTEGHAQTSFLLRKAGP